MACVISVADVIVIDNFVLPGAMLEEVTPDDIVSVILMAWAKKVLPPVNQARVEIVGAGGHTPEALITSRSLSPEFVPCSILSSPLSSFKVPYSLQPGHEGLCPPMRRLLDRSLWMPHLTKRLEGEDSYHATPGVCPGCHNNRMQWCRVGESARS
jgi:hypothetical protein